MPPLSTLFYYAFVLLCIVLIGWFVIEVIERLSV